MKRKISEESINRRIKRGAILTSILVLIVSSCGILSITTLKGVNERSQHEETEETVQEYLNHIEQQFQVDLETLSMMSIFVGDNLDRDREDLSYQLKKTKKENPFIQLGYYSLDGKGIQIDSDGSIKSNLIFSKLNTELQEGIKKAWDGESVITNPYEVEGCSAIAYVLPVYQDKKIIAALIGVRSTESFDEILEQDMIADEFFNMNWMEKDGNFIALSDINLIQKEVDSIFESEMISDSEKNKIKEAIRADKAYKSSLVVDSQKYDIYFSPFKENNWYLVYLDTIDYNKMPMSIAVVTVNIVFILMILFNIFIMTCGCYMLKRSGSDIINLTFYDTLTGCYNFEKFKQELAMRVTNLTDCFMVTLNIRDFQYINDMIGSRSADGVLCDIAHTIEVHLREDEIACRANADQFYFMLHEMEKEEVEARVFHIMERICQKVQNKNISYPITLYAGIARMDEEGKSERKAKDLLHRAEFAQKQVEKSYENRIFFYDQRMRETEKLQKYIESHRRQALENEEFQVYLQPKFNVKENRLSGAEALVRWIRKDGTMVYPDQFIPMFEKNGFCVELDLYMFEKSCELLARWQKEGKKNIWLSVNQSRLLFYRSDYVETLEKILKKYEIPRGMIQIEILEGIAAENINELNKVFQKLHGIGLRLALDDFGTGYSSLNILSGLDIDEIKFDKQFLLEKNPQQKEKNKIMIQRIVELVGSFSISTVVEGIESEEDESFIRKIGCTIGQGYYYSPPISIDRFEEEFF